MIVRFFIQKNAGLDDYLMLAALVGTSYLYLMNVKTDVLTIKPDTYVRSRRVFRLCHRATRLQPPHLGRTASNNNKTAQSKHFSHTITLASLLTSLNQMTMAIAALYIYGATLIKLSVLTFDRRLGVNKVTPKFLLAVRFAIFMVLFYCVVWTVLCFRQCTPFKAYWEQFNIPWRLEGHPFSCLDEGANTLSNTVFSTICDFIAFLLPLSLLWRLQISKKQKMALGGVFSVGLLVCVVGIVRIVYITRLYYFTYDATWEAYHVYGATAFELLLATICASAAALKIFFRGLRGREISGGDNNNSSGDSNSNSKPDGKAKSTSRARSKPLFDEEAAGDNMQMEELEDKNGAKVRQMEEDGGYENEMKRSSTNTSSPSGEYEGLDYGDGGYGSRASRSPLRRGEKEQFGVMRGLV